MTPEQTPKIINCPTCGRGTRWSTGNPYRPFCSDRCRLIDLGAWAGEDHRIAGNPVDDDVFSEGLDNPPT